MITMIISATIHSNKQIHHEPIDALIVSVDERPFVFNPVSEMYENGDEMGMLYQT